MKVTLLHGAVVAALSVSYQAQAYNCQDLSVWDSSTVYNSGDQVQTKGAAYEAAYWRKAMIRSITRGHGKHGKVLDNVMVVVQTYLRRCPSLLLQIMRKFQKAA